MKNLICFLLLFSICNTVISQDNYYWEGGQGNWSDLNSWRTENGQIPISVPGANDNVIFNEESFINEFDTVYIDILNPSCKSMIWENIPFTVVLAGDSESSTLSVNGSIKFHLNVINIYKGTVDFISTEAGNTIELNGNHFMNDIQFNGNGGEWSLMDDLVFGNDDASLDTLDILLERGTLITNGYQIVCGSIISGSQFERGLDLTNSTIELHRKNNPCWLVDLENMDFTAIGSNIYINGQTSTFTTKNGIEALFGNIILQADGSSVINIENQAIYDTVFLNNPYCTLQGNLQAISVIINADHCFLIGDHQIYNLEINADYIEEIVSNGNITLNGSHHYGYARFTGNVYFMDNNTFDTLVLAPTSFGSVISGGWFYFQAGTTQTINDSLFLRGHQCSNININSLTPPDLAYIRKDYGEYDVYCDFLQIYNVAAQSETLNFYAGTNSVAQPDPNNPPPGWIFENDTSSFFGWQGELFEGCWGEPVILDASAFEGWVDTEYYWNGSTIPGDVTFEVTEPDTVSILIVYAEECYIEDYAIVVFDSCEIGVNDNLYDLKIRIYPNPGNGEINLKTNDIYSDFEFQLYGSLGEMIYTEELKPSAGIISKSYDFSYLKPGIYFAHFKLNKGTIVKKVIIW